MGIDLTNQDEVVTLSVAHPSDAPSLLGKSFVSPWFTMDGERSDLFEKATYLDSYPHPYPASASYGDDLVEGFHLVSMLDYLLNHVLWSGGPWIAWNYGLDHVRFVSVVRWSDRLRIRGEIAEVIDRGEQGHLFVVPMVGEIEGRERPGFVATQRFLWTTGS